MPTHPDTPATVASSLPESASAPTPEILAVIAAAVATVAGSAARIAAVTPGLPVRPSGDMLVQQWWSIEGRRQIYSSHQVR